jgi:hypothetical protein
VCADEEDQEESDNSRTACHGRIVLAGDVYATPE